MKVSVLSVMYSEFLQGVPFQETGMDYLNWSYEPLFWRNLRFHCGNINSLTVMWFSQHVSWNYMISKIIWTEIENIYTGKKINIYIYKIAIYFHKTAILERRCFGKLHCLFKSLAKGMAAVVKNKENYTNMAISFVNVSNFSFFCRLSYHFVRRYISNPARKNIYFRFMSMSEMKFEILGKSSNTLA